MSVSSRSKSRPTNTVGRGWDAHINACHTYVLTIFDLVSKQCRDADICADTGEGGGGYDIAPRDWAGEASIRPLTRPIYPFLSGSLWLDESTPLTPVDSPCGWMNQSIPSLKPDSVFLGEGRRCCVLYPR